MEESAGALPPETRARRKGPAWAFSAVLAATALLCGVTAGRHLLAFAVFQPTHRPPPRDLAEIARELEAVRAGAARSPSPGAFEAWEGRLLFLQGEIHRDMKAEAAAREAYEASANALRSALEARPLDAATCREMTLALERLGRTKDADAFAARAVTLAPANAYLQFKIGLFYFERRAFVRTETGWTVDEAGLDKAFACFRKAAESDLSYFNQALALMEKHLPGRDCSPLLPGSLEARLAFARHLARKGRWPEVARIEEEVIAAGRDGPEARIRAGEARLQEGKDGEALAHFRAAIDGWLLAPSLIERIRSIFSSLGKEAAGAEFFLSAGPVQPEEAVPVAKALGMLYFRLERYGEAEDFFSKAAMEASDSEAFYHLGAIAEISKDYYAAERHLRQAIRGQRDDPRFHHKLAEILEKNGNFMEALREYETAVRLAPGNAAWKRDAARMEKRWREGR